MRLGLHMHYNFGQFQPPNSLNSLQILYRKLHKLYNLFAGYNEVSKRYSATSLKLG
jgi:hypothetical protein